MASYNDLANMAFEINRDQWANDIWKKLMIALCVVAEEVVNEDPATPKHDARLSWARGVLRGPSGEVTQALWMLVAKYKDTTVQAIYNVSDEQMTTLVRNLLNEVL